MPKTLLKGKLLGLTTYSQELGLDVRRAEDRFKWFLASILFAKRISAKLAMTTFKLRELRSVWPKASPRPSPLASGLAKKLGLTESDLELPGLESALVRVYLDFCKRQKCTECPLKGECCYSP